MTREFWLAAVVLAVLCAAYTRSRADDATDVRVRIAQAMALALADAEAKPPAPKAPPAGNIGICPCKRDGSPCLCVPASKCPSGCPQPAIAASNTYATAYAACLRDRLPLVVFVGVPSREIAGCHAVSIEPCAAFPATGVFVGRWQGRGMVRVSLAATADDGAIVAAMCES